MSFRTLSDLPSPLLDEIFILATLSSPTAAISLSQTNRALHSLSKDISLRSSVFFSLFGPLQCLSTSIRFYSRAVSPGVPTRLVKVHKAALPTALVRDLAMGRCPATLSDEVAEEVLDLAREIEIDQNGTTLLESVLEGGEVDVSASIQKLLAVIRRERKKGNRGGGGDNKPPSPTELELFGLLENWVPVYYPPTDRFSEGELKNMMVTITTVLRLLDEFPSLVQGTFGKHQASCVVPRPAVPSLLATWASVLGEKSMLFLSTDFQIMVERGWIPGVSEADVAAAVRILLWSANGEAALSYMVSVPEMARIAAARAATSRRDGRTLSHYSEFVSSSWPGQLVKETDWEERFPPIDGSAVMQSVIAAELADHSMLQRRQREWVSSMRQRQNRRIRRRNRTIRQMNGRKGGVSNMDINATISEDPKATIEEHDDESTDSDSDNNNNDNDNDVDDVNGSCDDDEDEDDDSYDDINQTSGANSTASILTWFANLRAAQGFFLLPRKNGSDDDLDAPDATMRHATCTILTVLSSAIQDQIAGGCGWVLPKSAYSDLLRLTEEWNTVRGSARARSALLDILFLGMARYDPDVCRPTMRRLAKSGARPTVRHLRILDAWLAGDELANAVGDIEELMNGEVAVPGADGKYFDGRRDAAAGGVALSRGWAAFLETPALKGGNSETGMTTTLQEIWRVNRDACDRATKVCASVAETPLLMVLEKKYKKDVVVPNPESATAGQNKESGPPQEGKRRRSTLSGLRRFSIKRKEWLSGGV